MEGKFYFNCWNCPVCRLKRQMNSVLAAIYFRKGRREQRQVQKLVKDWLKDDPVSAGRTREHPYPFGTQPFV